MPPKIIDVSHEEAITIASELTEASIHETPSMKVTSGNHQLYGAIHVCLPAMGGYMLLPALLPIVIQNFSM
jgi:hypothetical protein